jgi:glutamyl-tRNA synthetase
VGTAYIALFNYCFAKKNGGKFILRIEDTDVARSNPQSEAVILQSLRWLGIEWDEGPEVGGPDGPYRQSERGGIYRKHADLLLEKGDAFRCFCTPERLAEMRKKQRAAGQRAAYDGLCLNLSKDEVEASIAKGVPFVVRMKVPQDGESVIHDLLRGEIRIAWNTVDMQVLLKPDGMPTYHLANVVDDHLMGITHVLRGEEWINSAPKHQLLYRYFGWEMPALCHMPLLRNPDRSKLSKRKNPTSLLFYRRMGFLPEALVNYLGLMAWSMPSGEEKFSLPQMVENFSLERISLGGPIFDMQKLKWLNGKWIREDLDQEAFAARAREWAVNEDYLSKIIPLVQLRISVFSDLGYLALPFFTGLVEISPDQLLKSKLDSDTISVSLQLALIRIEFLNDWKKDNIEKLFRELATQMEVKLRDFLGHFYIAIMGRTVAAPLFDAMELLGRDISRARLRHAFELVGEPQSEEKRAWLENLQQQKPSEPEVL